MGRLPSESRAVVQAVRIGIPQTREALVLIASKLGADGPVLRGGGLLLHRSWQGKIDPAHTVNPGRRGETESGDWAMSLAIAYILDAAAEESPNAIVHTVGQDFSVKDLNQYSVERAERYLDEGYEPGDHLPLPPMTSASQLLDVLAALRVGLVLCDGAFPEPSRSDTRRTDRDVAESRIWSETPAAIIGSRTLTQGDVIQASDNPLAEGWEPLQPALALLRRIQTAVTST